MRKLTLQDVTSIVEKAIQQYKEELETKVQALEENKEVLQKLTQLRVVEVTSVKDLVIKANSGISWQVEKYFKISMKKAILGYSNGIITVDNDKLTEYVDAIFEEIENKYKYNFVETKKSICYQTYDALYNNENYWEFKVKEVLHTIAMYYDLDFGTLEKVPSEVGTHEIGKYKIKLQKNGKIYVMF